MFPTTHGVVSQGGKGAEPSPPGDYEYGISTLGALSALLYQQQAGWALAWRRSNRQCVGVRIYLPTASGTEVARLWRAHDQALLATTSVTPIADGWSEALWSTPVTLEAGTMYLITTRLATSTTRSLYISSSDANTGFVFNPQAGWLAGINHGEDNYPGAGLTSRVRGIVDLVLAEEYESAPSPFVLDMQRRSPSSSGVQGGWEFETSEAITVTRARILAPAVNSEVVRVWRVSDQQLLGSAPVTTAVDAWAEEEFSSPIALAAGTRYAVTTQQASGSSRQRYDGEANMFLDPTVSFVRGRYTTGAGFPSTEFNRPLCMVDLRYVLGP